jgi:hypothetical protein
MQVSDTHDDSEEREPFLHPREWLNAAIALMLVLAPIVVVSALSS